MKSLIVYDSQFGNTQKVAEAMCEALGDETKVVRVSETKPNDLKDIDLLIVGSPTQAFRPTKATTEFLDNIPDNGLRDLKVAAFDTRISPTDVKSGFLSTMVKWFGYAANPIADKLQKKGGKLAAEPEGFLVKDKEGPLKDGELERAIDWAKQVANK